MDGLVVEDLIKRYGSFTAVDGLSFAVPRGSVCGFLGPNGAGKTTTLRILFGLSRPTSGRAEGHGRISGILDRDGFHPARSVWNELSLAAARAGRRDADIDAALAAANLSHAADKRVGECSHGTRRRLSLAAALIAAPDVLLLDEPASGLDPHALRALRERLQQHASEGGTVLLSSHVLEDVAATCDRVVVVNRGRRVAEGDLQAMLAQRIRLRSPEPEKLLGAMNGFEVTRDGADTLIVAGADPDAVGRAVRDSGAVLHEMSTQGALEALYVGLTEAS
ncbi:ATP-binding cassette domain-containing protein [Solirubrobacter sp. CPCC 204708]|uniref:ATP-binding cassette domain-containing protein n=1 Tax=Solirubrobacter deserti TaxID=2282478 RepID=A0ABT4RCH2_9ACTN|nr:ATP-binding cassette domain-containing protein [Solirubrobacter deserti]MBE2317022.1 ATP-binding cassette domain-containing protein [Solirubrobacter deserti]MDA0136086.1 ATP-binding cassette domain-containing protein [Solirubrobacter deserti]